MAGHSQNGDRCCSSPAHEAAKMQEAMMCKSAEVRRQQVHEDLDDLGRAQQACSELLDQLASRLSPVLGPPWALGAQDSCGASPEPSRCDIAGRVRSSYITVCDVNGRLQELVERLQV